MRFSESRSWLIRARLLPLALFESALASARLKSESKSITILFLVNVSRLYGTLAFSDSSEFLMFSNHSPLHRFSTRCFFSAVDCSIPESASIIAASSKLSVMR